MTAPHTLTREVYRCFREALMREGPERAQYLSRLAPVALADEVQALLAHAEDSGCDPAQGLAQVVADIVQTSDQDMPSYVGSYQIISLLGQGGMGRVYLAEQAEPRRKVALKLMQKGFFQQRFLARFEQEKQTLARLNHPYIVGIFAAGATDQGHPYLVMEHIEGRTITQFCREERLSFQARLDLFLKVCEGVKHAHQKAVIHCDLKPGNILVSRKDGQPFPHLIDFGIARLCLQEEPGQPQLGTQGTPAYMSPEQGGHQGDVDVRADVFALGMVLFELLLGELPKRMDCQEVPPLASDYLRTMDKTVIQQQCALMGISFKRLEYVLKRELDWVLRRALAPEREQRFATVSHLIDELTAFREARPLASVPGKPYRVHKQLRRYRREVFIASLTFSLLVAGILGTSSGWRQARLEADSAERSFAMVQEMLASANPNQSGRDLPVSQLLDGFRGRIDEDFAAKPQEAAKLHHTFAKTYIGLGMYAKAFDHAQNAVSAHRKGPNPAGEDRFQAQFEAISALFHMGRLEEGRDMNRPILNEAQAKLGENHVVTLQFANLLGVIQERLGAVAEAESMFRTALKGFHLVYGDAHEDTLSSRNNLASLLYRNGRHLEAVPLQQGCVDGCLRLFGEDHPYTLIAKSVLAGLYSQLGRHGEAETLLWEIYAGRQAALGPGHPSTVKTVHDLAQALESQGQIPEALAISRLAHEARATLLGSAHPQTLNSQSLMGLLLGKSGVFDEADRHLSEALRRCLESLGEDHPKVFQIRMKMARVMGYQGCFEEAENLFLQSFANQRRLGRQQHRLTVTAMAAYAQMLIRWGRRDAGQKVLREVVAWRQKKLGPDHPDTQRAMRRLTEL